MAWLENTYRGWYASGMECVVVDAYYGLCFNIAKLLSESSTRCLYLVDCEHAGHPSRTYLFRLPLFIHNYTVDFFDFLWITSFPDRSESSVLVRKFIIVLLMSTPRTRFIFLYWILLRNYLFLPLSILLFWPLIINIWN